MRETNPEKSSIRAGYELRDMSAKGLFIFAILFALTGLGIRFGMRKLFSSFKQSTTAGVEAHRTATDPLLALRAAIPEPRLQTNAPADLKRYLDHEHKILSTYGWIDRSAGTVRIPINRAIDILVLRSNGAEENHE